MIEFNPHIIKKLKFKSGSKVFIFDSKGSLSPETNDDIRFVDHGSEADGILFFVDSVSNLNASFLKIKKYLKEDTIFWAAYPKKSSGIKSDLERDRGWDLLLQNEYEGVALVSLNKTWSAMRFKKKDKVKKGGSKAEKQNRPELTKYIDYKKKVVRLPEDVLKFFSKTKQAKQSFEALPWSHPREHIESILEAKSSETRTKRILKLMDHLNPKKPK